MTARLARLADLAYRRRGRMVLAWIVATVVIIGVGSSLAGEYNADYNTPGSESKAAERPHRAALRRLLRPGDLRRLEGPGRAPTSPAARQRINAFFAEAEKVDHIGPHTPIRVSEDGKIGDDARCR